MTQSAAPISLNEAFSLVQQMRTQIAKVMVGQQDVVDQVLVALLASGHVLIEGVPGLGKTLLVKSLARCFAGAFGRVQFTPDLMPSDITGHALYDMKQEQFKIRRGPAFTNLLLADEINRAPAKTQAALLEVMQEKQITIEGKAFPALVPFMVLATQNPIEHEGTYPLPEAELDRFMLKVLIDYPKAEEELLLVKQVTTGRTQDTLNVDAVDTILNTDDIPQLQNMTCAIQVDDAVFDYAVRIARSTRQWHSFAHGAGPRASIALVRAARAHALLQQREFVTPDDVKQMTLPVLRHRVALSAEMEIEGMRVDDALLQLLNEVEAPRL